MALGDITMWDEETQTGLEEIACECVEATGEIDEFCELCEGEGILFKMLMPEHDRAAIFQNLFPQMPHRKH